jgi:hypothetical protein
LTLVTLVAIGSVIYWIFVGLIAVLGVPAAFDFGDIFDGSATRTIWVVMDLVRNRRIVREFLLQTAGNSIGDTAAD